MIKSSPTSKGTGKLSQYAFRLILLTKLKTSMGVQFFLTSLFKTGSSMHSGGYVRYPLSSRASCKTFSVKTSIPRGIIFLVSLRLGEKRS